MADNFGLKIGIEGEKEFKNAIREINQSFKVLGSEMNLVASQFDKQDKSVEAVTARNKVLNKEIELQKEKIATLEKALANAASSFGETDRRTQSWQGLDFAWNSATNAEKAEIAMQMFLEKTEQYAGNFARESTQTISGSIGLLQASLSSFIAGLGNANADMTNLTQNLVDAFQAVVKNIVPVLENIVAALPEATGAIISAVKDLLPVLVLEWLSQARQQAVR